MIYNTSSTFMQRIKKQTPLIIIGLSLIMASCKPDENKEPVPKADYSATIDNSADVILATYSDLAGLGLALQTATQSLESAQTAENLEAARSAWISARAPWEESEGFLFGPVDAEGLDPSIDSWPVNVTDLNNVLNSGSPITAEFLNAQEGTLKGFHTIEFLLWGTDGEKQVAEISQREFEYLSAASEVLAQNTQALYDAWRPGQGNFIENLQTAGKGSLVYVSQKGALEEMANAIATIADEVGNGKINTPFALQDLSHEESQFSANSKRDFANNIRSIQNIYTGKYGESGNGKGLSDLVVAKNPALDAQIRDEISTAITSIDDIPGTFSEAVFNSPEAVQAAQTKVRTLQETLESQLIPYISGL